jgi:hypothetical protein
MGHPTADKRQHFIARMPREVERDKKKNQVRLHDFYGAAVAFNGRN